MLRRYPATVASANRRKLMPEKVLKGSTLKGDPRAIPPAQPSPAKPGAGPAQEPKAKGRQYEEQTERTGRSKPTFH
jgi:hypothetical protein